MGTTSSQGLKPQAGFEVDILAQFQNPAFVDSLVPASAASAMLSQLPLLREHLVRKQADAKGKVQHTRTHTQYRVLSSLPLNIYTNTHFDDRTKSWLLAL